MTTLVGVCAGHDVRYFTNSGAKGCSGAMNYYTASGEPDGEWTGKAAPLLGLAGQVDAPVIDKLFMENIAPTGERLVPGRPPRDARKAEAAAVSAWKRANPFHSQVELAEFLHVRSTDPGPGASVHPVPATGSRVAGRG
jgi:hypothetical protein